MLHYDRVHTHAFALGAQITKNTKIQKPEPGDSLVVPPRSRYMGNAKNNPSVSFNDASGRILGAWSDLVH